jgi:hypothetical protein
MLDLTSLSNTCAYLYLSSINMIKSVAIKPITSNNINENDLKLVYINITGNYQIKNPDLIQMDIIID